jgi:O-antigen ligase
MHRTDGITCRVGQAFSKIRMSLRCNCCWELRSSRICCRNAVDLERGWLSWGFWPPRLFFSGLDREDAFWLRLPTWFVVPVLVAGLMGLLIAPTAVLHRLTLLTGDEATSAGAADLSAIESQWSRIELIKRSVYETVTHPLFGVGPGQFPVAVMEEAKARGEWFQWLGTHNSYTQISSECGIPTLIFYVAVIIVSFQTNLRIWKRSRDQKEFAQINTLSVALLSGIVVFAVCAFFFHMGYTGTLPILAGQTIALYFAADPVLRASTRVPLRA